MNILNKPFDTQFHTAPFSKIKNEHFLPAFKKAIEKAKKEIEDITNNPETPSFKNTVEALDFSGEELDRISSIFFNLNS
ncbi:MAG: M3 family peptidase, partial [Xanthomarina gelatinilytica]|nr:M3 family peptidase [Xanthomarina gelatinilytica]